MRVVVEKVVVGYDGDVLHVDAAALQGGEGGTWVDVKCEGSRTSGGPCMRWNVPPVNIAPIAMKVAEKGGAIDVKSAVRFLPRRPWQ
jgi:hypothetical protein